MRKSMITIIATFVVVTIAMSVGLYLNRNSIKHGKGMPKTTNGSAQMSHKSDTLNLISGNKYLATKPVTISFKLVDPSQKIIRELDVVHDKKLHLIVVRKDRLNFQHVHPSFNSQTGEFTIGAFIFPTNGEYRVYAEYTNSNSRTTEHGSKQTTVVFQDVNAGDVTQYHPEPIGGDKFSSESTGLKTQLRLIEGEDGPGIGYVAGVPLSLGVDVSKNDVAFKDLQKYLGALGHMVILGPNLEYIHAHALSEDIDNQTGLIIFNATLDNPGRYKVYLQTQADGVVNTTDYTITAKANPYNKQNNTQNSEVKNHGGH